MKSTILLIFCLITSSPAYSQNSIEHPKRDRIPYVDQTDLSETGELTPEIISKINDQFSNTSLKSEIGQSNDVIIGSMREVEVYNSSEFIILDERRNRVIMFNELGAVIDTIGRAGQGPGEYKSPYSIELDGNDLYLADRSFSVNKYVRTGGKFEESEDFKINVVPDQLCILKNEVFIRGSANNNDFAGDEHVIHVYDKETLSHTRSIINPYKAEGYIAHNELNEGKIFCDRSTNSIFVSFNILPYIYSFSTDGTLNWVTGINNFQPRRVVEKTGPPNTPQSVTFRGDMMYDSITGFTDLDDDIALVQIVRNYSRSENKIPELTTYAFDKIKGDISLIDTVPDNWILLGITQDQILVNGIIMNGVPSMNIYRLN